MSRMFKKIKEWYDHGLWNKEQIRNAVIKGQITEEEYKLITDEDY